MVTDLLPLLFQRPAARALRVPAVVMGASPWGCLALLGCCVSVPTSHHKEFKATLFLKKFHSVCDYKICARLCICSNWVYITNISETLKHVLGNWGEFGVDEIMNHLETFTGMVCSTWVTGLCVYRVEQKQGHSCEWAKPFILVSLLCYFPYEQL